MTWSHSSKLATLLVALVALAVVAPAVAAVSTDAQGVPEESRVGEKVTATFTLTDLYDDYEEWTLHGETELRNVTWTVTKYDQAGNQLEQTPADGQSFDESISLDENVGEVEVEVTGTVPAVENYSYDPPQSFTLAALTQTREGGNSEAIDSWSVHHHTEESAEAREELESAEAAIADGRDRDADVSEAEGTFGNAVSSFENENFENAADLANQAERSAEESVQSAEQSAQTRQLLLYGGVALVALVVVGGGLYWWRSNQDSYDKLG